MGNRRKKRSDGIKGDLEKYEDLKNPKNLLFLDEYIPSLPFRRIKTYFLYFEPVFCK
jgi:hypothetical protein